MGLRALLGRRSMRHFLLGTLVSQMGTGMSLLGGAWYLRETFGSDAYVGYLGGTTLAAGVLCMGRLGVLVDGFDRKWVMVGADLYRFLLTLLVPLAFLVGHFHPGVLFGVVFLRGFGHTTGYPNLSALIGELVTPEERPHANGLLEVCLQVGMAGGAALAGFVYVRGGLEGVFLLDASTFLVSAAAYATMPFRPLPRPPPPPGAGSAFREGWRYLLTRPLLLLYGLAATLPWMATMSYHSLAPGFVKVQLGAGALALGFVDAAYAVGGGLAGLLGAWLAARLGVLRGMVVVLVLGAAGILGHLAAGSLPAALIVAMVFGLGCSAFRVIHRTFVLQVVPNHILGRVFSVFGWVGLTGSATGMVLTGRAMEAHGVPGGVWVLAGLQLASLAIVLILGASGFFSGTGSRSRAPGASPSSPPGDSGAGAPAG